MLALWLANDWCIIEGENWTILLSDFSPWFYTSDNSMLNFLMWSMKSLIFYVLFIDLLVLIKHWLVVLYLPHCLAFFCIDYSSFSRIYSGVASYTHSQETCSHSCEHYKKKIFLKSVCTQPTIYPNPSCSIVALTNLTIHAIYQLVFS